MRFTDYFEATRTRPDRAGIRTRWIARVVNEPEAESVQADGHIRRWACIEEAGGRYLRVVLLEDGETVHSAFFDRTYKP